MTFPRLPINEQPGVGGFPAIGRDAIRGDLDDLTDRVTTVEKLGTLGYAEVTANQGSIGGTFVALTGLSVSLINRSGRLVRITGKIDVQVDAVSDTTAQLVVVDDGSTVLGHARHRPNAASRSESMIVEVVVEPVAGADTYELRLRREVGTGTLTMVAGSGNPAQIVVEDIGAAT